MKIGILTFPRAINYGAALQATALQNTLQNLSNDTAFMPYKNKKIEASSKVFDISQMLSVKYTIAHLYNLPDALKRKKKFDRFCRKNMDFGSSDPYSYDAVITGSDQVWNYNLTDDDWFYYLDFDKKGVKKISYAASLGVSSIEKKHIEKICSLINDFDYLSVRERTAEKLLSPLSDKKVEVVIDPTLLLNKKQWEKFSAKAETEQKYIFVYTVFNSDKIWDYAEKLSKKTGLPIKTISYSRLHRRNAEYDFTAGPDDWLSYMLGAEYVVTNSFHGVAFSINFEKNFFFDMPPAKAGVGSRISDIIERYKLSDRNLSGESFVDTTEFPDFSVAREKLEEDRKFSFDFINSFLNNK